MSDHEHDNQTRLALLNLLAGGATGTIPLPRTLGKELEERGLVERAPYLAAHKRTTARYRITPQGRDLAKTLHPKDLSPVAFVTLNDDTMVVWVNCERPAVLHRLYSHVGTVQSVLILTLDMRTDVDVRTDAIVTSVVPEEDGGASVTLELRPGSVPWQRLRRRLPRSVEMSGGLPVLLGGLM